MKGEEDRLIREMPKDLLIYSRDEFKRFKASLQHIVARARQEGVVLHART